MQDSKFVISLRDGCSEEAKVYAEVAYQALNPVAGELLQARKIGVIVTIPASVRQEMLAAHGDEAAEMLSLLDGRVFLESNYFSSRSWSNLGKKITRIFVMKNKTLWILALVALLYGADAAYPQWDWQCTAVGEFHVINRIPEVEHDPTIGGSNRHLRLTLPQGCEADPHNLLRKLVELLVPANKKING